MPEMALSNTPKWPLDTSSRLLYCTAPVMNTITPSGITDGCSVCQAYIAIIGLLSA